MTTGVDYVGLSSGGHLAGDLHTVCRSSLTRRQDPVSGKYRNAHLLTEIIGQKKNQS